MTLHNLTAVDCMTVILKSFVKRNIAYNHTSFEIDSWHLQTETESVNYWIYSPAIKSVMQCPPLQIFQTNLNLVYVIKKKKAQMNVQV